MLRHPARFLTLAAWCAAVSLRGAAPVNDPALARYDRLEVAATKTSIYIGRVTMTMPAFVRAGGTYETTYTAKVFPYFFSNENGTLKIEISDDMLRAIDRGQSIEFKGRGVSTTGEERPIEGKATPTSATEGKLKVRVFVSKRIELIFNTTYRLAGATAEAASSQTPNAAAK